MKSISLFGLLYLCLFNNGYSQNDVLPDSNFGTNGEVTSPYGDFTLEFAAIAIQPDGKLVTYGPINPSYDYDLINDYKLARYNTDGSLDTTFGNSGFQYIISCYRSYYLSISPKNQLKIQPDGKILIVRTFDTIAHPGIAYFDVIINRFNPDGSLDTTFGNNGEVVRDYTDYDIPTSIEIQPDNKILVAGYSGLNTMIFRLNSDGSADKSFGIDGTVLDSFKPFNWSSYIYSSNFIRSVKLQSDGKIILGGESLQNDGRNPDIGFMRLNPNGTLDTSFGIGGIFIYESGNDDNFNTLSITPENKIVVFFNSSVFYSSNVISSAKIFRLNTDGKFDVTFGINGISTQMLNTTASLPLNAFIDVAVDANQKFVFIGHAGATNIGNPYTKFIGRYNSDGSIDNTFNSDGYQLITTANLNNLSVQDDGKILYGGNNMTRLLFGTLSNTEFNKNEFSIFPNPFSDKITLKFNFKSVEVLSVDLYDSFGRKIKNLLNENSFLTGNNSIQLNMPETLSKGIYFLKITNGMKISAIKIMK